MILGYFDKKIGAIDEIISDKQKEIEELKSIKSDLEYRRDKELKDNFIISDDTRNKLRFSSIPTRVTKDEFEKSFLKKGISQIIE